MALRANILRLGDVEQLHSSGLKSDRLSCSDTSCSFAVPSLPFLLSLFYGLLLAWAHFCCTAGACMLLLVQKRAWNKNAVIRHLTVFLLTLLQFIKADAGG